MFLEFLMLYKLCNAYLNLISDTEIYSFVTDEKGGCSTHCPVNKGNCKYYNSITDFCRIHCTTDCLFTPRDPGLLNVGKNISKIIFKKGPHQSRGIALEPNGNPKKKVTGVVQAQYVVQLVHILVQNIRND